MNAVGNLLRRADPLAHEPLWASSERLAVKAKVLAASPTSSRLWPRRAFITSITALGLIAGAAIASRLPPAALQAAFLFEVRLAEPSPAPDLESVPVFPPGRTIYLHRTAVVTNADIAEAKVVEGDPQSTFAVEVTFNEDGAEKMRRATSSHVGRPLAFLIDGEVITAPVVRSPVSRSAQLNGHFTRAEAERIANGIVGQ